MPTLNITAPDGAKFEFDEVKTDRGQKSLGDLPILVWTDPEKARAYYGDEGILNILDGTSVRVSMQSIARRLATAAEGGVTQQVLDEIAKKQVEFKPGSRNGKDATPESKALAATRAASKKVNADAIGELLRKIASGEVSEETLRAMGIQAPLAVPTSADEGDEAEETEGATA